METKGGEPTVRLVEPCIAPNVARTVVLPWATALARPEALMVATPVAEELQVTDAVKFCVLPLLNLPVATYCFVPVGGMVALAGVTVREVRPVTLPAPLRVIRAGLPKAPKFMVSMPERAPTTVGVNVTPTWH